MFDVYVYVTLRACRVDVICHARYARYKMLLYTTRALCVYSVPVAGEARLRRYAQDSVAAARRYALR